MPLLQLDGTYLQEKSFVILESPTTERNPNKKPNIPVMDGRKPRWLLVMLPHKGHKLTDPGQYCSRLERTLWSDYLRPQRVSLWSGSTLIVGN